MSGQRIPFEQIQRAALAQAPNLLRDWFPAGRIRGHTFYVGNLDGEPGASLKIDLTTGLWNDFAAGDGGGYDMIDVRARMLQIDRAEAARELADTLGVTTNGSDPAPRSPTPTPTPPPQAWHPIVPPPADAPKPDPSLFAGFSMVHEYCDAEDRLLFYVRRKEANGTARKQFLPLTYGTLNGVTGWHTKHPNAPRPLYGLNRLATMPDAEVLLCEGEKAADAAQAMFPAYACVSWPGGADAVRLADLSPLRHRRLTAWPDADTAGLRAMATILERLPHGRMVRVDGLREGFDAADLHVDDPDAWLRERLPPEPEGEAEPEVNDDARPPEFTDEALALEFSARYADRLRYVAAWGRWFIRGPAVWREDQTMRAFDLSRAVCRNASAECNEARVASSIASAKTVAAVERLAKADRRHAATVDQWDADPWLLNTPGGVVNLRNGIMRPHKADDQMTKLTAVAPGGNCPLWLGFLDRITAADAGLQAFLQRVTGYSLTGNTDEHALFFGHGPGGNGKGVFLGAITGIMGAYAAVALMETFTASQGDRHPTELAKLRGARLVTAQETEEGRRWAEARIKALTGGDVISARFMRQDFFEYKPQFKLFIVGNHKPGLRSVDEAIRRRFHMIPFEVKIPAEERDITLPEKLKAEWPGILAWAIDGCVQWQRGGLAPPSAVRDATDDYLEAEDALGLWMAESCTVRSTHFDLATNLFASWKGWAEKAGEFPGSQKRFSQALEARGLRPRKQAGTKKAGFEGIAIRLLRRSVKATWEGLGGFSPI